MKTENPIVSVICITYGHEEYIAQALESFLMQKTTFPYQILVGEDKGPDRTAEIVLEYAEKYPDKIIPFIREENMGAQRNLIDLCRRAGTKYLAFCEGDDYWTDEYKLQKQFDLMEAHPEYRACFHNTMIMADPSWYLYGYYKPDKDGNIYIPESIPNYDITLRELRMDYYIKFGPAHTSSLFYRWDDSREIPEWYYSHMYGDHSLVMIQVGDGVISYIPETMSVYRRSEVGVLMYETKTAHFLRSRGSWIDMAIDLERYFTEHYNSFAVEEIRERIIQEFNNYSRYIVSSGNLDLLADAYKKYSYPASLAVKENADNRLKLSILENQYSEKGLKLLLSDKQTQSEIGERISTRLEEKKEKRRNDIEERISLYFEDSSDKRDNEVWVFSQEDQKYYSGNVRHLYEYIIAFHPEINAYWLTKNRSLLKMFEAENLPSARIGSEKCTSLMRTAGVAVTNCFTTLAYNNVKGFSKDIKVVRLGNGVSLTGSYLNKIQRNDPRLSPDSCAERVIARFPDKYEDIVVTDNTNEYFIENYEKTFLQIATNQEIAQSYEKLFGIKKDNILICGSPRSYAVYNSVYNSENCILMVPGWRDSILQQEAYINDLLEKIDTINEGLEKYDMNLCIHFPNDYLHSSFKALRDKAEQYTRITLKGEGCDIYSEMEDYPVMITDWSEVMFDFMVHDKPVVILKNENKTIDEHEAFLMDYDNMLPGETAKNWYEALEMCSIRMKDHAIDKDKRERLLSVAYDMSVNDDNNAERIIQEIKNRIENK